MKFRSSFGLIVLLLTFSVSAWSQSFPPALGSPTQYSTWSFDRSPSLATDPTGTYPYLYMAFGSNWRDDYIYINYSQDGTNWNSAALGTLKRGHSPSIAFYKGHLYVAFVSDGGGGLIDGALYLAYTDNPSVNGWSQSPQLVTMVGDPIYPTNSPTLAVFNGQLWVNWVDKYQSVITMGTTDGISFTTVGGCGINDPDNYWPQSDAAVGMTAWNGRMYYAYQTSSSHILRVCSVGTSGNDYSYSSPNVNNVGSGVSALVYGNYLTFSYKNYSSNNQVVAGTSDGTNYTQEQYTFSMNASNQDNPATAVYKGTFYMVFTGNSSNQRMWQTHN
jgi:hypothetical protein